MRVNPPNETTIMHSNIVQRFLNSHVTNSDIDIAFWFGRHSADNRFYGKTSHFHRSNGKRLLYAGADRYDQCRYFLVLLSSGVRAAYLLESAEELPDLKIAPSTMVLTGILPSVMIAAGIFPTHLIDLAKAAAKALM